MWFHNFTWHSICAIRKVFFIKCEGKNKKKYFHILHKIANIMNLLSIRLRGSITIINPLKIKKTYFYRPNYNPLSPIILMSRIFSVFFFFIILIPFPYTHFNPSAIAFAPNGNIIIVIRVQLSVLHPWFFK